MSILPVNACPLGDQVWRLDFTNDRPWLEVNKSIPGIKELAASNEQFFALVYPEAIRRILMHVLFTLKWFDSDGPDSEWSVQWLRWAIHWHPDSEQPEEDSELELQIEWIETVVESFCKLHNVTQMFITALGNGSKQ